MSDSASMMARDPQAASILRRRALADRLMAQSTQQDFRHPLSIGATLAQSLAGAFAGYQADEEMRDYRSQQRTEAQQFLAQMLGGQGSESAPAAASAAPAPPAAGPQRPAGGIRTGAGVAVPANLDDADILARTLIGEASNQGEEGQRAVAHVIRNRMQQTGAGVRDVVLAPNQFEPWGARRDELLGIATTDPRYITARNVAQAALDGQSQDPTGGATHFLNPDLQRQLGRAQPAWAPEGLGQRIGAHVFYNPGGGIRTGAGGVAVPASPPAQPASAPAAAPAVPNMQRAALAAMLSDNPDIARMAPVLAQMGRREDNITTAAPGSTLIRNGQVVGQIPERPRETEELITQWRRLQDLGERATPAQVAERDLLARRIGGQGVNVNVPVNTERGFYGELAQQGGRRIDALQQQATQGAEAMRGAQRVQALLDSGVITGTGAGTREAIERAFVTAGLVDGRRVANTGQLMSELASATLSAAGGLSGPTSDRDIMFLRDVVGGRLDLTPDTIRRVVQVASDRAGRTIQQYNDVANGLANDPNVPGPMRTLYRPVEVPTVDARPVTPAAAPRAEVPQRPQGVPEGSAYSPSRNQWRTPDGRIVNQDGTAAQ